MIKPGVITLLTLSTLFLPVLLIALDGKKAEVNPENKSRWANVDLTQYCGKTIGELLDDLGNDYERCEFYGEHPVAEGYFFTNATFIFNDASITITPRNPLKHLIGDRRVKEWSVEDLEKEKVSSMEVSTLNGKQTISINSTDMDEDKDFIIDLPKYIGWTVDSVIKDISHIPVDSHVLYFCPASGEYYYIGCWFRYDNGVELTLTFDNEIPHPGTKPKRIMDTDYFKGVKIRELNMWIDCADQ